MSGEGRGEKRRGTGDADFHSHFAMRFDLSPPALKDLQETLRADPGVVRWTVLKKGEAV